MIFYALDSLFSNENIRRIIPVFLRLIYCLQIKIERIFLYACAFMKISCMFLYPKSLTRACIFDVTYKLWLFLSWYRWLVLTDNLFDITTHHPLLSRGPGTSITVTCIKNWTPHCSPKGGGGCGCFTRLVHYSCVIYLSRNGFRTKSNWIVFYHVRFCSIGSIIELTAKQMFDLVRYWCKI